MSYYLYDGSTLTAEANAFGDITRQYVYLEGRKPIAMLAGNETYAIPTDHTGAPRQMSNAKGEIVWRADYTAFGKATLHDSNSISLNLRFPGQYADEETGTYYNYFRDYDPESGRYRTSDPMGQMAGLNTYAYANGLPQNLVDPLGLAPVVPVLAGSAFYAWLSSAATVSNPVGWLVGGTVALGVAAYWYANHNTGGEQEFLEQTDNVKPSREDYFNIRFEIGRFDESLQPGFGFDDTWGSLFAAQNLLLQAQQNYVDRMDAIMAVHGEGCLTGEEQGKYDEAQAALALAAAVAAASATVATTPGGPNDPKCEEAADGIKKNLYANKKAITGADPSNHGYIPRKLEQICGMNGPTSTIWDGHKAQLDGKVNSFENHTRTMQERGCSQSDYLNSTEKNLLEKIRDTGSKWNPKNTPHFGPLHSLCEGVDQLIERGNVGEMLSLLGRMLR